MASCIHVFLRFNDDYDKCIHCDKKHKRKQRIKKKNRKLHKPYKRGRKIDINDLPDPEDNY